MALEFEKFSFKEINLMLDKVGKWLQWKDISLENTRFEAVKNNMCEISTYQAQEKVSELRSIR